ncbi:Trehalose-6-phosphate synthase [bacterium HR23]|nr:Trehalose-6-phosphate synthase [bacterium HR23]
MPYPTHPPTGRLLVVSNRAPYTLTPGGKPVRHVGGLVSALEPVLRERGGVWVAAGSEGNTLGPLHKTPAGGPSLTLLSVPLSEEDVQGYYHGFANRTLWPLCHFFLGRTAFEQDYWRAYNRVNRKFAQAILAEGKEGDTVWVHDYHLALVPSLLRKEGFAQPIGFFWHIPFPPAELWEALPWARDLLEGMLGADLIGFHTPAYVANFLDAVEQSTSFGVERSSGVVHLPGRRAQVVALPVGVDTPFYHQAGSHPATLARAKRLRQTLRASQVILAVDRLDYTKGLPQRLRTIEHLLERHPRYRGRIAFVQIAVPSRSQAEEYRRFKREVDELVGSINGRFARAGWFPIHYFYRSFTPHDLAVYYRAADIALVTPLRDGLNLVAGEYVAANSGGEGVLILSQFAGIATYLPDAFIVNPYDYEQCAEVLHQALSMSKEERALHIRRLQAWLTQWDVHRWASTFLSTLVSSTPSADTAVPVAL